jgi:CBS domain-containing protein
MMQSLRARDLMTPDVMTVPPETPVVAIARLLAERGFSAVPVTGAAGRLLGIVTEADLIRRLAGEEGGRPAGSPACSPTRRGRPSATPAPTARPRAT